MRPQTAAEWLSENSERQELAVMNIPLAMELYAKHVASFVPKDVVDEIMWQYPIEQEMYKFPPTCKYLGEEVTALQEAARYGYSLAAGESVRFAEWITKECYEPIGINDWYKSPNFYTTETLYSLFKKESNG